MPAAAAERGHTGTRHGALVGLVVGGVLAGIGEGGSALVLDAAPYGDVAIMGFATVYGLPSSVALGALLGRWGRPARTSVLAAVAAVPAALVAIAQIVFQVMHV